MRRQRRARYDAFADVRAEWLALAHHRDDQAETLTAQPTTRCRSSRCCRHAAGGHFKIDQTLGFCAPCLKCRAKR
ncbi:MAG: hypothetical protein IPG33_00135 [Betaproteobacteria bacterium]|nr:hypothetical protein [Betaproteobacteria bacterium]